MHVRIAKCSPPQGQPAPVSPHIMTVSGGGGSTKSTVATLHTDPQDVFTRELNFAPAEQLLPVPPPQTPQSCPLSASGHWVFLDSMCQ